MCLGIRTHSRWGPSKTVVVFLIPVSTSVPLGYNAYLYYLLRRSQQGQRPVGALLNLACKTPDKKLLLTPTMGLATALLAQRIGDQYAVKEIVMDSPHYPLTNTLEES